MYAYGYKNTTHAYYNLANAGVPDKPCEDCGSCTVKCPSGFAIKQKITDIARIRNIPQEFLKA